ncbi:hypothetical protein [Hyphomonas sp.]|jgi:heme/copper-type cytochrome/quinol oxidase subunit 2|uniref:hypothetical protein n=2 Tax=Hyphomonas sp. TaxID=87 RepID=UPI0032981055|tara:strand:- start:14 stop:241 length:228 start_codon:yes stop_codon:yes gene_type:complete
MMQRLLNAIIPTFLISEIAAITLMTMTWAILSELHAGLNVIIGGEVVTAIGVAALSVAIFRRAFRSDAETAPTEE